MTITRPTLPAVEIQVSDRLLVLRGEVGDVVPALPLVVGTSTDASGQVVLALAERPERPLVLDAAMLVTVERASESL